MKKFLMIILVMSGLQTRAQDAVAASKEPLHKNVFENEYVRLLELHIAPGDTTLLHKHEKPLVSISLHPVRTGVQTILDDSGPKVASRDRGITFDGFYQSPRIHRVWNRDTAMFHWMDVEVLSKGDRILEAPIALDGFAQAFDAPPVRAYRLTLKANQQIKLKRNAPMLIIGLTDNSNVMANNRSFLKQGDFIFVRASKKISIANKEDRQSSFAVLELK